MHTQSRDVADRLLAQLASDPSLGARVLAGGDEALAACGLLPDLRALRAADDAAAVHGYTRCKILSCLFLLTCMFYESGMIDD